MALASVNVIKVVCGEQHTLVITDEGEVIAQDSRCARFQMHARHSTRHGVVSHTAWYPIRHGSGHPCPRALWHRRAGGQVFSFGDDAHGKLGHGASAAELAAAAGGVPQSSDADDVKHEVRVGYTSMSCLGRQLRWRTPSARPAHSRPAVRGRCLALALARAAQIPALPLRRRTPPPSAHARAHAHHAWALWRMTQARKLTRLLSRTPRRIDALAPLAIVEISAGLGHSAAVDVVGRLCVRCTALPRARAPRGNAQPRPLANADRPRRPHTRADGCARVGAAGLYGAQTRAGSSGAATGRTARCRRSSRTTSCTTRTPTRRRTVPVA